MIPGYSAKLQSAATTGNGTAVDLNGECHHLVFYIEGAGTVSAGAVTLEEASTSAFAGTWSQIGSVITVSTACQAVHVYGAFGAVRARISTEVTGDGGNVSVRLVAN